MYVRVAIPVPLKQDFIYSFDPDKMDICPGKRVTVMFHGRKTRSYAVEVLKDNPLDKSIKILEVLRVIDKEPVFDSALWNLALWMEKIYFSSRGIAIDTMVPGGKRDVSLCFPTVEETISEKKVVLTEKQEAAVNAVVSGNTSMYYLYGVTGSGKTEVFLKCAQKFIELGKQVIYLVPEITLTHQLAKIVLKRFKGNVAVLHSAMTDSQRITQWKKIRKGEISIIIGARSAVFAPCPNLGLIVIDEEHESSYKSGNDPRYHARQIAQHRIQECNGKLLMGSATPSLEAWYLMKNPSIITRIDLPSRVGGGIMPVFEVADMTKEKSIFSRLLIQRMSETISRKKQIILFLNRRGYSYYFHCRSCGFELKCPHCDVAMTYHKSRNVLVCHYCGHREIVRTVCPVCGSHDVLYSGFGTEQVEDEIKKIFPHNKIARLDTDTVSLDRSVIEKTLNEFGNGDIDILLGTQMVAKGLDFPNVELVGIILADSTLLVPDFRSQERTFDLLVQVSGRSGRAGGNGRVVIQTRAKDNNAIVYACNGKTSEFYDNELEMRKQTGFPPYSRIVCITVRSAVRKDSIAVAENIASALRTVADKSVEVFGAQESPIEKVRENWRFQVVVRCVSAPLMLHCITQVMDSIKIPSNVYVETDVDPAELL